eukprot:scaffold198229_cov33-Prasinocladus_malaysianus.AAC.1
MGSRHAYSLVYEQQKRCARMCNVRDAGCVALSEWPVLGPGDNAADAVVLGHLGRKQISAEGVGQLEPDPAGAEHSGVVPDGYQDVQQVAHLAGGLRQPGDP